MLARLTVDLEAIRANIAALRALAAPARIAPVVKANAYGHGAVAVARAIEHDADRLCVYELDEGLALREAGIRARIHVLGPLPAARLGEALAAGLETTLWSDGAYLDDLRAAALRSGRRARVHAKIDTGVTRLGMSVDDAPARLAAYRADARLELAGVFSHLAAAEELESAFTQEQTARFEAATASLAGEVERHLAASAAAMLYPRTRFDAIRPGIAIYGLWPSPATRTIVDGETLTLRPALAWQSELVVIHDVPAGTSVGYGCTFQTTQASRIGVLPIGYAEGIPRAASSRASVLVDGVRAPIVGRICMNMSFVDVTHVAAAHPGSRVTLIGEDGHERIEADEWAAWCETINYEIVTRLPAGILRVAASPAAPAVPVRR